MENNTEQYDILKKYPTLKNFTERMVMVAEDILSKAIASSTEENRFYEVDIEKYNVPGEPIIDAALLDNMLTDTGMVENSMLHEGYIDIMLTEEAAKSRFRSCLDSSFAADIEIICARHILWIYDGTGGEQVDFSNCRLENIDFSCTNLCAANLKNALFINCNFTNTALCDADFSNSTFINCNFTDMVAERSYQIGTKYINCDLTNAYFTGSNFKNAEIRNSKVERSSFMNCCLENLVLEGSTLDKANTTNVSYDELEWSEDGAGREMALGGM